MLQLKPMISVFITYLIKLELNILYFFTLNTFGYALYCYFVCVFVFGQQIEDPDLYQQGFVLIAALIILEVISMSLFFFIVLRFQSGRDLIYSYVPRAYVISCIGNPGHKTLLRSLGALMALTSLDLLQQAGQSLVNRYTVQNYIDVCRDSGYAPKDNIIENIMLNRRDTGAKLGHILVDPGSTAVKSIIESTLPPTKP